LVLAAFGGEIDLRARERMCCFRAMRKPRRTVPPQR